jgi:hypothetical protein
MLLGISPVRRALRRKNSCGSAISNNMIPTKSGWSDSSEDTVGIPAVKISITSKRVEHNKKILKLRLIVKPLSVPSRGGAGKDAESASNSWT